MKPKFLLSFWILLFLNCTTFAQSEKLNVFYEENFDKSSHKWAVNENDSQGRIENGVFYLSANTQIGLRRMPALRITKERGMSINKDIAIEVAIKMPNGASSNSFGVEFGLDELANQSYFFLLNQEGKFRILKRVDTKYETMKDWTAIANWEKDGFQVLKIVQKEAFLQCFVQNIEVFQLPYQASLGESVGVVCPKSSEIAVDFIRISGSSKGILITDIVKNIEEKKINYHVLLIGVNDYQNFEDLDNPLKDIQKLKEILLKDYYFDEQNLKVLKNPTKTELINVLDNYKETLKKTDNLLIFYAGHGKWIESDKQGYWLTTEAKPQQSDTWFANKQMREEYLDKIFAHHILLISDACYAGGFLQSREVYEKTPEFMQKLYQQPSRKVITSGNLEEVPDKSIFMQYLIQALQENKDKFLPSFDLFARFKNNLNTNPQWSPLNISKEKGGDFIFVKRK